MGNNYDIIIIGAGISGLRCATYLYENSLAEILILEAQDRLGGRVNRVECNNDYYELGAMWIHGIQENPIYELVEKHPEIFQQNIIHRLKDLKSVYVDENGNEIDFNKANEYRKEFNSKIDEIREIWFTKKEMQHKNVEEYLKERIDFNGNELKQKLFESFLKDECIFTGCNSMNDCSLEDLGSYKIWPGGDILFPNGYSTLVTFLSSKLREDHVKLNHAVKSIKLTKSNDNYPINICCSNGNEFNTKYVVVTCSLQYLKLNYQSLFEPGILSVDKINALNRLDLGIVDSVIFVYDNLDEFFPSIFTCLIPVVTTNKDESWYLKIPRILRYNKNGLRFYINGKTAIYLETLEDTQLAHEFSNYLKKLLKNDSIPLPTNVIRSKWYQNEFIKGSYSYIPLGATQNDILKYQEPVFIQNKPRVLFSGEGTHEQAYSTIHGAYLSGEREAKRLLENFKPEHYKNFKDPVDF